MTRAFMLLLLFTACNAYAGDTLTRAQVYNFNVGDTFDYRHFTASTQTGPDTFVTNTYISYTRQVVTNTFYSPDSLTKYIVRQQIYPTTLTPDTLILTNLQGQEVVIDTTLSNTGWPDTSIVSPLPDFFGRTTNYITFFCCSPGWEEILFARGLGKVVDHSYGSVQFYSWNDSTTLVYYGNDSVALGTPYYDFPTGIQQLNASNNSISIFPTVNDGVFHVKITHAGALPVHLIVCDISGREVKQVSLTEPDNTVNITPASPGIYIWRAMGNSELIQAGKMLVY